ncbi:MAG: hypothetical protein ACTSWW_13195 [Promethearchaeota archaeon]
MSNNALTRIKNIEKLIQCVDISITTDTTTDLMRWVRSSPPANVFRMDLITARKFAKEEYFLHIEKADRRLVYIKKDFLVFIIVSDEKLQFQLLEAILEVIVAEFYQAYGEICNDAVLLAGMKNILAGFLNTTVASFDIAQENNVLWISSFCGICNKRHMVAVRKSLIKNAVRHPVSLVFEHEGHGLLIYIDSQFQVRGQEVVQLTG